MIPEAGDGDREEYINEYEEVVLEEFELDHAGEEIPKVFTLDV